MAVDVRNGLAACLSVATISLIGCVILWFLPGRQLYNPWIFMSLNRRFSASSPKAHKAQHDFFFFHLHSSFRWLKHQTANAVCSHYSRLRRANKLRYLLPQKLCATLTLIVSSAWIYVCVYVRIQLQRIPDSIAEPIKDHLFHCANLILPCAVLTVFLPMSRSAEALFRHSKAKAGAELLTEYPWHPVWQFHAQPLIQLTRLSTLF